jgi:hypothetical protein
MPGPTRLSSASLSKFIRRNAKELPVLESSTGIAQGIAPGIAPGTCPEDFPGGRPPLITKTNFHHITT